MRKAISSVSVSPSPSSPMDQLQTPSNKRQETIYPKKFKSIFNILKTIILRILMISLSSYSILFLICMSTDFKFLALIIPVLGIICDTIYICVYRRGKDFYWFSFGSFCFTCLMITLCWLSSDFLHKEDDIECKKYPNITNPYFLHQCIKININFCKAINMFICVYLIFVVFTRWMTPFSNKLSVKSHSELVALLLAAAADVVDFIEYSGEESITEKIGIHLIYAISFLSVLQFCFTLTSTKMIYPFSKGIWRVLDFLFGTEAWSVVLVFWIQDVPYLIVRIVIISKLGVFVNSKLLFFFLKNIFMVFVDFYRLGGFYHEFLEMEEQKRKEVLLKQQKAEQN